MSRPRVLVLRTQGEQAPNPESRVRLGSGRDDLGMPVPRVTWRSTDDDLASVKASAQVLNHTLRARGIGLVDWTGDPDTTLVENSHHHLGTTRMRRILPGASWTRTAKCTHRQPLYSRKLGVPDLRSLQQL